MQTKRLHKKYYYISKIDERDYSKIVWERKQKLELFDTLMCDGCSEEVAIQAIGMSRSKYYRLKARYQRDGLAGLENQSRKPHRLRQPQWPPEIEEKVCGIRNKFRVWGKDKIAVILKREFNLKVSISTVGRILSKLIKNGKCKTVSFYTGKYSPKPRIFNDHAQRLPTGAKSKRPGELVQVDHMTVKLDSGKEVKHFDAMCPTTHVAVGKAYRQATSLIATDFLDFMVQQLPFPLLSVQVDGGSEFKGEFEQACKSRNIPLFVTPPRSPQINGAVERGNGTVKYEFYSLYDKGDNLSHINDSLQQYMLLYNNYRPHRSLQGLTPMEYCIKMEVFQANSQSHMY
jgi:transposase